MRRIRFILMLCALMAVTAISLTTTPTLAQGESPAAYLPSGTPIYVEIGVDENLEANIKQLIGLFTTLSQGADAGRAAAANFSFDSTLGNAFPNLSFTRDILPWVGGRAAIAVYPQPGQGMGGSRGVLVIPIANSDRAQTFLRGFTAAFPNPTTEGDVTIYSVANGNAEFAVGPNALWIGQPTPVEAAIAAYNGAGSTLADDDAFSRVWAGLPGSSNAAVYVSGEFLRQQAGERQVSEMKRSLELLLRLMPGDSPMEQALIAADWFSGIGVALNMTSNQIDITALLTFDATYTAPSVAPVGADSALLSYVPRNAFLVIDTSGFTVAALIAGLLLAPAQSASFSSISVNAAGTEVALSTPTTPPTPTVDEMVQQVQPALQRIATAFGVSSIDQVFQAFSGEFVAAAFPADTDRLLHLPGASAALWIQTDDAAGLVSLLNTGLGNIAQLSPNSQTLTSRQAAMNGVDVTFWTGPNLNGELALGALNDHTVFIAPGETVSVAVAASQGDGALTQSPDWPGTLVQSLGTGNEGFLYLNPARLGQMMSAQGNADGASKLSLFQNIVAAVDAQDDGQFMLRLTGTLVGQ